MLVRNMLAGLIVSALVSASGQAIAGGSRQLSAQVSQQLVIEGALTYRVRLALPPAAKAVVELREGTPDDGKVVASQQWMLKGQQVPLPFQLKVPRQALVQGKTYWLRGAVWVNQRPTWLTEPVVIHPAAASLKLGPLSLLPYQSPGAFSSQLQCGQEQVTVGVNQETVLLTVGREQFELRRVPSASGSRYQALRDPSTTFWSQGDRASITLRGRRLTECYKLSPTSTSFRARGNEPFWSLDISPTSLTFQLLDGKSFSSPTPKPETALAGRRYTAQSGSQRLTALLLNQLCVDSMSGMPYPQTVRVRTGDKDYQGCGGDPASLLQGAEWVVEDLNRTGIIDNSRLTLRFADHGHLSGRASCNTYLGQYKLTGEALILSPTARTLMACPPALMQQERRFLNLLRDVNRFEIPADRALILHTADGRTITARR